MKSRLKSWYSCSIISRIIISSSNTIFRTNKRCSSSNSSSNSTTSINKIIMIRKICAMMITAWSWKNSYLHSLMVKKASASLMVMKITSSKYVKPLMKIYKILFRKYKNLTEANKSTLKKWRINLTIYWISLLARKRNWYIKLRIKKVMTMLNIIHSHQMMLNKSNSS